MKLKQILAAGLTLVLLSSSFVTAYAAGDTLTITAACSYAMKNNTAYLNLVDSSAQTERDRNNTVSDYMNTQNTNTNGSNWLTTQVKLMQYDTSIALQSSNEEQQRLSLQNTLTKYFMNIITAENSLKLAKQNLEISAAELKILKAKLNLGLISQTAYNTSSADYEKSANDLKTQEASISSAYIELNKLMGKPLSNRYTLELDFKYAEIGDVDLNRLINNALTKSTTIKQKESDLEIAAFKRDQWWAFSSTTVDEKENLELQVTQARRALDDAKENLRVSITNSYNDIKKLEVQISTNQIELKNMKAQLAVKEVELELGKITSLDVKKYNQQIVQLEETIRQQIYNHELTVWQFGHPEVL